MNEYDNKRTTFEQWCKEQEKYPKLRKWIKCEYGMVEFWPPELIVDRPKPRYEDGWLI